MLERFKRHYNRPITWGKYYKLCGISMLLSFIFSAIYVGYAYLNACHAYESFFGKVDEEES